MFNSKLYFNSTLTRLFNSFTTHHSRNLNSIYSVFNVNNNIQRPTIRLVHYKNSPFLLPHSLSRLHNIPSRTYTSATKRSIAVTLSKPARKTEPAELTQGKFKTYTPRTPGLRWLKRPVNDHLWKGKPIRKLTIPK